MNFLDSEPLYIQVYQKIKIDILAGKLKSGDKLPSKRSLAKHLEISINTVEAAYQQLIAEGYVVSQPKRGVFVQQLESQLPLTKSEIVLKEANSPKWFIDFSQGMIDTDHFPLSQWRKYTNLALDDLANLQLGHYQGEFTLRKEISSYIYEARGVTCSPEQIVIGAGTQYLLKLLLMLFDLGTTVAMEDPGFHRARMSFGEAGMNVLPVTIDKDGLNFNQLYETRAKLFYCTPSHQFPLGAIMPIGDRQKLLQWATEQDSFIIEDDYDGEFRYEGKPIPALQGLDKGKRVIYLGTFSKSLVPAIRLNFLVLPPQLLKRYQENLSHIKQPVSKIHQRSLAFFMQDGHWQRHLNRMRTLYRKKQETLLLALDKYFGDRVKINGEKSGLHIVINVLDTKLTEVELIERAAKVGIKVYPTSIYYIRPVPTYPQLLIGYGGVPLENIPKGIKLLADVWC
ncbi:PLP-dependent aminotransferase family protein [Anaerobacillus alkaliphilus]|uniref:PLP-dependent aminotransferase family protein n=2 Tax=Anaerobacillus alkaliphilus TaxID=1548597 RepID=A0A4Q0VYW6_9BACI|nr:PLP-dependent aminotransferase family protein [Anaerobacillus alkaliphilus]